MGLYTSPPPLLDAAEVKPTLLVCWWTTIFCFTIILLRIAGRYIRSERLFVEDRTVSWAIIPLFLRMGCVHAILILGTNNVDFDGSQPTAEVMHRRAIGSGLVLASRVFYAATLWIFKITILEFFKRISDALSERFSQIAIVVIRWTLVATFVAVVISDLAECQPFGHYWQVFPDPGGQCRQGFAQLLTMSICNIFTDLLLVILPIPIIFFSGQSAKRRVQLILLFSLSLGVVGVTIYRLVRVLEEHGSQPLRSLLASVELLFATAAANSIVLGSFVRDRGVKKNKFRAGSTLDSMDRASIVRARRPTANRHWGSDEDLVRGLGLGVHPELRNSPDDVHADGMFGPPPSNHMVRPAPTLKVDPTSGDDSGRDDHIGGGITHAGGDVASVGDLHAWHFPHRRQSGATNSAQSAQSGLTGLSTHSDDDTLLTREPLSPVTHHNPATTPRKVSFFDNGNILSGGDTGSDPEPDTSRTSTTTGVRSSASATPFQSSNEGNPPSPVHPASGRGLRRGSAALIQDLGGLLGPPSSRHRQRSDDRSAPLQTVPQDMPFQGPTSPLSKSQPLPQSGRYTPSNMNDMSLMDLSGLLGPGPNR